LHALGHVEGHNILIEQRYASGAYDRVPELAADLVRRNMDVIAVDGPPAAKAVKAATATARPGRSESGFPKRPEGTSLTH
jgi:hypothetical protein